MVALVLKDPATGRIVFNSETITAHIRGRFVSTSSAGSVTIPGLSDTGVPFVLSAVPVNGAVLAFPTFTISGNTVSWGVNEIPCRVVMASRC